MVDLWLSKNRTCFRSTIVEHLLYEDMMFHPRHFTMAMRSLARRGLWPDALRLLPEMRKRQLTPNCLSYNVAMDACQKGHAWQRAIGLWQDGIEGERASCVWRWRTWS